jgi:hypothetical protein
MFNTPKRQTHNQSSSTSSALVLSPLRGSASVDRSQLIYGSRSPDGSNTAVVLYDSEQQVLVARRVGSPVPTDSGADPNISAGGRRCPLCNSELSSTSTNESNYFSTLSYFHRHLPLLSNVPSHEETGGNPFLPRSPTEATRDLHDLSANLLINGYYGRFFEEVRLLGTGSFGSVYLCRHVIDSVYLGEFAVKKVPVGDSREWLRGMMREVKALERLATHPNIVSYKHSWLEMHRANELCPFVPYLFILMSYCDGGSLDNLIQITEGFLPDETVWSLFLDVCQGLQHLHRNFVVHRDLKLGNILLTGNPNMRAVLSDFGTAEIVTGSNRTASTSATGFTGTAEFTAPEVFRTHTYADSADMWSLGIVLYALCYGKVPFSHPDPAVCARMIMGTPVVELPDTPERDSDLRAMITALTDRDPSRRPSCDDILFHPFIRQKLDQQQQRR